MLLTQCRSIKNTATLTTTLKARYSPAFAVYLDLLPAKILSCRFVQIRRHNRMSLFPFYIFAMSQNPEHCDVGVFLIMLINFNILTLWRACPTKPKVIPYDPTGLK
jgi:hypothetical protein